MQIPKPIVLVVLDGWGHWSEKKGNAIYLAKTPTFDKLDKFYPKTLLQASGLSVGLPWGVYGNSEVGHQTLGTGQVIYQYLPVIVNSIQNGTFFQNEVLLKAINTAKERGSRIHLMGLTSDGGVHSHINHLIALLELCKEQDFKDVFIQAITDGRDTAPKSAKKYFEKLLGTINKLGVGKIASMIGRYYTMDRNENWDRNEEGVLAMMGQGEFKETDVFEAIDNQYKKENVTDEYFKGVTFVDDKGNPVGDFRDGDVVIFFNFRKDRARQISTILTDKTFDKFKKIDRLPQVELYCFTKYGEDLSAEVVFPPQDITVRLGEILSKNDKKQFRIAETEKYAHVTYFFNGGLEEPFAGEDRKIIPSKNVESYAQLPEMSAYEVTQELLEAVESDKYDFILVNYANSDMVGHTGVLQAGVKAIEFVDKCIDQLIKSVLSKGGNLIITADHGNVEEMINLKTGGVDTEHSANPVPCWFVTPENHREKSDEELADLKIEGMIVDIAPTVLELSGLQIPADMTGDSLLEIFNKN